MKQMKLLELKLRNFKGIRDFRLRADGQNVSVYGDNASGKTTLFDAFVWLLFDKDSQNKKDFQIKTVDQNGNEIHGLDHEVEAVLLVDGKKITLRKVFKEKWTKKRGSATADFTGHTTDYFIDSVPVKKKEFTEQVSEIADEDIFKLLTNPIYFNEQLHWQERRKILLEVAGDITDEDVISSSEKLAKLPDILQGRKLEDHRKVIAARRAEINKELDKIPVRIDEVQRGLPDIKNLDESKLEQQISLLKSSIQGKEKQISRIENGGEISIKQKEIAEIEAELIKIKNSLNEQVNSKVNKKLEDFNSVKSSISEIEWEINNKQRDIEANEKEIMNLKEKLKNLRDQWHEINNREFTYEQNEKCPTCGQALPTEQIEEARKKALTSFNLEKANELEEINKNGKTTKEKVEWLESENKQLKIQINILEKDLKKKEKESEEVKIEIEKLQKSIKAPEDNSEYQRKLAEKQQIENEIAEIKANQQKAIDKIMDEIEEDRQKLAEYEAELVKFEKHEYGQKRIEELKQQEKELAAEFERLEEELYLTEEFIRTKVNMLEEKINSKFKYARFKLFETQVNGGLNEVCETLYKGVPYSGGLNNAARINVGLDIINTLSEYYGFSAPIFIDNREAVTELIETKGQLISLVVSKSDKQLRVEHEDNKVKEAV